MGKGLLSIGALQLLISLALFATSVSLPLLMAAAIVVHLAGLAVLVIRMQRYLG